jgi:hypothetical protein
MSRRSLVVGLLASLALVLPATAAARRAPAPTGYDVSYPQCNAALPTNVLFGIVGVNDGIVYSANPCLGAGDGPSELVWAEQFEPTPILYANTADPGPALSSHWPTGQTSPEACDPAATDSAACSYDYGWDAAADSYQDVVNAYVSLGQLASGATQTPAANEWWLDVETANSWESDTSNNISDLEGAVAYLQSKGVTSIGFYASGTAWQTITGGTTVFSNLPSWRPGTGSREKTAKSFCGTTGVTGGPVKYSQYSSGGVDADVECY